jgi:hypothetical protein
MSKKSSYSRERSYLQGDWTSRAREKAIANPVNSAPVLPEVGLPRFAQSREKKLL